MNPNLWVDSGVSSHCLKAKQAEWALCLVKGDCFWSQCAIVLDRTHIWDTPLLGHSASVMARLASQVELQQDSLPDHSQVLLDRLSFWSLDVVWHSLVYFLLPDVGCWMRILHYLVWRYRCLAELELGDPAGVESVTWDNEALYSRIHCKIFPYSGSQSIVSSSGGVKET